MKKETLKSLTAQLDGMCDGKAFPPALLKVIDTRAHPPSFLPFLPFFPSFPSHFLDFLAAPQECYDDIKERELPFAPDTVRAQQAATHTQPRVTISVCALSRSDDPACLNVCMLIGQKSPMKGSGLLRLFELEPPSITPTLMGMCWRCVQNAYTHTCIHAYTCRRACLTDWFVWICRKKMMDQWNVSTAATHRSWTQYHMTLMGAILAFHHPRDKVCVNVCLCVRFFVCMHMFGRMSVCMHVCMHV
jgi:hypothetical protein